MRVGSIVKNRDLKYDQTKWLVTQFIEPNSIQGINPSATSYEQISGIMTCFIEGMEEVDRLTPEQMLTHFFKGIREAAI